MNNKDNTVLSCLGIIVSLAVVLVVGTFANGWALSTIWNWFMTSIFHVVPLTLWQAVGVSMVFEIFTGTNRTKKSGSDDTKDKSYTDVLIESLLLTIMTPIITVFVAWIVLQLAF